MINKQRDFMRDADIPAGAPDHVVRTVTENSRTLQFNSYGFERE